jgi:hypothetical protein
MNIEAKKVKLPRPGRPSENALFFLRYLATLQPDIRFDSLLLHQHLGTRANKSHDLWVCFIAAYYEDVEKLGQPCEPRTAAERDAFFMLTPDQASLAIIYDGIDEETLNAWNPYEYELVLHTFRTFQENYPPDRYAHPWGKEMGLLITVDLDHSQNKTLEELRNPSSAKFITEVTKNLADGPEKVIEKAFGKQLEGQGISVSYQVRCEHGIADIVTPDAIYEIKAYLDRESLFTAIGQVLSYRTCINPTARAVVVGQQPGWKPVHTQIAQSVGVEVIIWNDSLARSSFSDDLDTGKEEIGS